MMGRLHVDMFLQDRFLLNGVDVKIRLVRTKDAFALMAGGVNPTYKVNIVDASVFAKKATLSTAVHMAHIKASTKAQPSIHPALLTAKCTRYRRVPCHTRTKTSSWANFPNASCIDNDFNVSQDEGNDLTRSDFGNGYTFFVFDLTTDACDGSCFHLVKRGKFRVEIHFATALAQTVNVVAYGEFEAVLEIDKNRNVVFDYRWTRGRSSGCWHSTQFTFSLS
ncbi:hypothetical protein NP493_200g01020 [Ridgeia piscesae]|uniref:Uncharacterized protein n=1 Tax=Ridgeia piscesae TaxID=27915 RepID=A0AAD9UEI3_RIDPI|nr:hypothetical protein NP493_200g01020 [Ridgeia piscesae]